MKPRMTPEQALAMLATMGPEDFPAAAPEDEIDDATAQRLIESGRRAMEKRATGRPSLTAPGEHSPQITLRLPQTTNRQLSAAANRLGKSKSQIVREAVDRYLATV
ncbi:MAG: ribbon-helix-helix protein, CopG family [Propionibacteriaceae bacterium]|jgi:hypothetical protein|nr:ribbon-helix-helix protein, CopG family [Propionibacteriaceae bacterium]